MLLQGVVRLAAFLVLLLGGVAGWGQPAAAAVLLSPGTQVQSLGGHWSALRDPTGSFDIEDVTKSVAARRFTPLPGDLAAGYDRGVWWLRTEIRRSAESPSDWLLEVEPAYLDQVSLFVEDERGALRAFTAGDRLAFSVRTLPYRNFVFRLHLADDLPHRVYLRIKSTSTVTASARILSPEGFALGAARRDLFHGLAHGASIIIILFALVQYAAGRDRLYLGFLAYAIPLESMCLAMGGLASEVLFPDLPLLADQLLGISVCLTVGGGVIFAARILEFEYHFPRMNRLYRLVGRGCQWAALSVPAGLYWLTAPVLMWLALVSFAVTTVLALRRAVGGDAIARWYLMAFLVQILFSMAVVARSLGLVVTPIEMNLAAHLAAGAHMLLIGCGLVWRGADIEADRHRVRQLQLESAQQVERALEERVRLRTQELAESNATLGREVAERRAAEDRINEREAQVSAILAAAPFPMMVSSFPDGVILYLNEPASELLNVPVDTAIGMKTTSFYVEPGERGALIAQLHQSGAVLGVEMPIRRLPGMQRWVLLSAVRFGYRGQDCALVCLNDITTRKQLEDMLRLSGRRAEAALEAERQAVREQRNFLAMVSHEFRVPLAIIEAASQLLGIYIRAGEEAGDEVAKIRRAVRRMSELIDICLADDRLDSNAMQLQTDRVDVTRMLADLCDDKRPFVGPRELILDAPEPVMVMGDATLLRIAFSNLIDNALKFSPPHTPVILEVGVKADAVRVRVSDQGPGIAEEEQPRIFEKFYRSTKSDRVRGAGLGLYIVKRIMDLHGTAISVDSRQGMGAAFDVWLLPAKAKLPFDVILKS